MTTTATPIFPQKVYANTVTFVDTDGNNLKTIASGGTNGLRIDCLTMSSIDNNIMLFYYTDTNTSTDHLWCTIDVAANSGYSPTASPITLANDLYRLKDNYVTGFQCPVDYNNNPYIYLAPGWELRAYQYYTTSTNPVAITVFGAEF
jgi:hypothetical protein